MTTDDLLSSHADSWDAAIRHPFLDGVRDGSLPAASFDRWLAQDYLFVQVLVRAQARITAGAPQGDIGLLAGGVVATAAELRWFEEMAALRGVNLDVPINPTNRAYCDFLMALTYNPYPAQITTIWAAERAYLQGWESARPGAEPYREFVDRWTTSTFGSYVKDLQAAVDRQLAEASPEQAREADSAFGRVARYERGFWDMAIGD